MSNAIENCLPAEVVSGVPAGVVLILVKSDAELSMLRKTIPEIWSGVSETTYPVDIRNLISHAEKNNTHHVFAASPNIVERNNLNDEVVSCWGIAYKEGKPFGISHLSGAKPKDLLEQA